MKKNSFWLILSFVLPVCIVAISYFRIGIYPTSELTILSSDGFAQLVNFYAGFNNMLHGEQSFFYTWSGSIGLNFVSLMSYYVNSIFSFIVYFFDNLHMPDAMYVIFLAKIGAMGVSFWVYASHTYKLPQWVKISFSTSYALISFTMAYSIFLMWMDALIYLPLVLLGIQRVMDQKKLMLLFISYFLLFVSNYYIAFMVGIFSVFYFLARLLTDVKRYKKSILPYFVTSFLSGGASMIIILPSILDIRLNGEKLDSLHNIFTDLGPWDMVVKNMPGVYDTSKYGSAPFIYIGLLPLIFCVFYFVSKKIPLRNKVIYGSLLLFLALSFHIEALNLFWHGFHSPYMFLFRFSFLFSVFVLIIAGFAIEKFEKEDLNTLINIVLIIAGIFLLAIIVSNKKRYDYISTQTLVMTFVLLGVYMLLFLLKYNKNKYARLLSIMLVVVVCCEMTFNTSHIFLGIKKEWGYVRRDNYAKSHKDIKALVDKTKNRKQQFYRVENQNPITRNDSFNFNYSGITMFSSIRNRNSSQYLNSLGFKSTHTNLNIQYKNNTLPMDALLSIKYNLSKEAIDKFGFKKIATSGKYSLYENQYALPLGILTDKNIFKKEINQNQTTLLQHLSDSDEQIYQYTELNEANRKNLHMEQEGMFSYFSEETLNDEASITWEANIPEKSQAYIILDPGSTDGMEEAQVEISVDGKKQLADVNTTGSYYNLGYYEKSKKINVKMTFSGQSSIRLVHPSVLLLNTEHFEKAINEMKKKEVVFKTVGNKAMAEVETEKEHIVYTTIPYDRGWTATIDGKKLTVDSINQSMVALKLPKGKHKLVLTYYPNGMKVGTLLFFSCMTLFSVFVWWNHKKQVVKEDHNEE